MSPAPDLQARLVKVDRRVRRLASLSDPALIRAGLAYARNHSAIAAQIGVDPATLSRALKPGSSSHRPLSKASREHLVTFTALRGVDVPPAAPRPCGRAYDASHDRKSIPLLAREATRLAWLAEAHPGGLEGLAAEALAAYLVSPAPWPTGAKRVPCPLPEAALEQIDALAKAPRDFAGHVRAAILAWMDRQPASPPASNAPRRNALLATLGEGEIVDVARVAKITGASFPVAKQIIASLSRRGAMQRAERGLYWLTAKGAAMAGATAEARVS